VTRVEERVVAVPHGAILSDDMPEYVEAERPWIDPFVTIDGRLLLSLHSFVIESCGLTIVVDTCVGRHGERPLPGDDAFPDRLAAAIDGGLAAVDVVLCTHLHFDHVGWNTIRDPSSGRLVPTFPSARYLVTNDELATYADHDHYAVGPVSVDPVAAAGLLDGVEVDHRITPEVVLLPTPGHTVGHVSVLIESSGESALITGDAVHSPLQFAHPHLTAERFDTDSTGAINTRRLLVDRLVGTSTIVLGTHFAPPVAGRIVSRHGSIEFDAADLTDKPDLPDKPA
jgi:glyoxylase-like metal-dependent hydrolase (beta-lactamase superfamily II)